MLSTRGAFERRELCLGAASSPVLGADPTHSGRPRLVQASARVQRGVLIRSSAELLTCADTNTRTRGCARRSRTASNLYDAALCVRLATLLGGVRR